MNAKLPLPDLHDLRGFHDYFTSIHEDQMWERLRLECLAKQKARLAQIHDDE